MAHCVRHPLSRFAGLPLFRGQNKPPRSNYFISSVKHSAARISPSGGDAAEGGRRGAFPTPVRAVCLFSLARQGGCTVLYKLAPLLFQRRLPPHERSDATLLYNPWHRGPEGPMDAIRPSAAKRQAPAGILESTAPPTGIYKQMIQYLFSPRSFACAQDGRSAK